MENRLVLGGRVAQPGKTRHSPAGIPITQFVVEHRSQQVEAGIAREVLCRIAVLAAGKTLQAQVSELAIGRPVQVSGFICRANNRRGEARLVLHAERIELLEAQ